MSTTTVTATYLDPSGEPCKGRVVFRLVAATYQDGLAAIFPTVPIHASLDDDGAISVELEPTSGDDAGFDADDMTYQVWERINGTERSPYYVDIPTASSVDLGTLATYDDPPLFVRQLVVPDLTDIGYLLSEDAEDTYARGGMESFDRHANHADGTLTTLDSGQTWVTSGGAVGATAVPRIVSGKITHVATGGAAGYFHHQTDEPVRTIGARFTLGSYSTTAGGMALCVFAQNITTTFPTIPDSPFHLYVDPTRWELSTWTGNVIHQVGSGYFSTVLASDNTTVHTVEGFIDRENSQVTLLLPDGNTYRFTDAAIGTEAASEWPTWEIFRTAGTDSLVKFVETWADSKSPAHAARALELVKRPSAPVVVEYLPSSLVDFALGTSSAVLDDTNLGTYFTYPASGVVLVTVSGYVAMTASTVVLVSHYINGANAQSVIVSTFNHSATFSTQKRLTGTPGIRARYALGAWAVAGSTATIKAHAGGGYPITIKIEAVQ